MTASMCFASRVGVLKGEYACPGDSVTIQLNTEDNNPSTEIRSQWRDRRSVQPANLSVPGVFISDDKSSITFKYCVVDVPNFNYDRYKAKFDYAVLLLDDACPAGSYKVKRHHDTEDNGYNHAWGNAYPNVLEHNADLYYCFVPKNSCANESDGCGILPYFSTSHGELYQFGFFAHAPNYVKLAGTLVYTLFQTEYYIDDEDSGNANSWDYYGLSPNYKTDLQKIMRNNDEGNHKNTLMFVSYPYSRQNGVYLSKSAEEENFFKPVDAQQLSAPMVKGLDRSAIAVELKSAGDVRITITNAKGAVVANIAENNLQSGIHQIKWNSGVIPNGRYIVTVKQNGMVNAKNVILK